MILEKSKERYISDEKSFEVKRPISREIVLWEISMISTDRAVESNKISLARSNEKT